MAALIQDGLVREDGEENSTGGRPGRRLELDPSRIAFGAEIQNWETRIAVCTMRGRIVESRRFRTPSSAEETLEAITSAFTDCKKRVGPERLTGIGVCARGIVDRDTGMLVFGSRADWVDIPVRQILETRLQNPVFVENNVRAAALAEYNYGSPEAYRSHCFLFVKIDEGVGMGILLDGELYYGPRMAAGEVGQMVIALSKASERHDRPGCLERLASNPALCDRYSALSGDGRPPSSGDTSARVRRVVHAATKGEPAARESLEEIARYLAVGISNVFWAFDADVVVVDGVVTEAWPIIEPIVREQLPDGDELAGLNVRVRPSALGGDAALIGAATLPFTNVFSTGDYGVVAGASA